MAKYKLKATSVQIGGIVHRKEEGTIFDTAGKFKGLKAEVEAAFKAGFLVKLSKEEEKDYSLVLKAEKERVNEAKEAAEKATKEKAEADLKAQNKAKEAAEKAKKAAEKAAKEAAESKK